MEYNADDSWLQTSCTELETVSRLYKVVCNIFMYSDGYTCSVENSNEDDFIIDILSHHHNHMHRSVMFGCE